MLKCEETFDIVQRNWRNCGVNRVIVIINRLVSDEFYGERDARGLYDFARSHGAIVVYMDTAPLSIGPVACFEG